MELYIHLPFCKSKCFYCNFNSRPNVDENLIKVYCEALVKEIQLAGEKFPKAQINTIYIGGGTPSFIDVKYIEEIVNAVNKYFNLKVKEFTIECNPESVSEEKLSAYKALGINRVSMGVQSLNDDNLKSMGRIHNVNTALESLKLIEKHFDNFSTDLIIGLPFDTLDNVKDEVTTLTNIVPHISMYELQLEEGSILYKMVKDGKIGLPDDDSVVDLFEVAYKTAKDKGFQRYEVSNFAIPGFESIHNQGYWTREEYLGLGAGASSFIKTDDGEKFIKPEIRFASPCIEQYIVGVGSVNSYQDIPRTDLELLDDNSIRDEQIMLGLRTKSGIDEKLIKKALENNPELDKYFNKNNGKIALTDDGFQIMNYILRKIL